MEYCLIEAKFLKKYLSHILYCTILYSHQLSHNLWGTYPGASPHFPLTVTLYHSYHSSPLSTHQSPPQFLSPFLIIHVIIISPPQPLLPFSSLFPVSLLDISKYYTKKAHCLCNVCCLCLKKDTGNLKSIDSWGGAYFICTFNALHLQSCIH